MEQGPLKSVTELQIFWISYIVQEIGLEDPRGPF